jgi:hypothetical protein
VKGVAPRERTHLSGRHAAAHCGCVAAGGVVNGGYIHG